MEIAGIPCLISISSGFSGKFLIKLVKMAILLINPKSNRRISWIHFITRLCMNMDISNIINKSAVFLNAINSLFDGVDAPASDRNRISLGLFSLALEHHGGIHTLVENKHYGSAFALLRPQFEAYVRGAWFNLCATEKHICNFKENKEPPKINTLIQELESTPGYIENTLMEAKQNTWSTLCAYTHGGFYHVAYRNKSGEVIADYESHHITRLINQACSISLLTGGAISVLLDSEELANQLIPIYDNIFNNA